jgi:flagellar hook-associated protein 3 FlgL
MAIRLTPSQLFRTQIRNMQRSGMDAFEAQQVAASGRKFNKPSDDAVGSQRSVILRELHGDVQVGRKKMDIARSELTVAESALAEMTNVISRLKELSVQMASEIMSVGARANAAVEVTALKDVLIAQGNTRLGEKRLFAGQLTGADPFDAVGNYVGDAVGVTVQLPQGTSTQVTTRGDDVLRGASGGPDIIQEVDNLIVALGASNTAGIQIAADLMGQGVDHVVAQRTQLGARMTQLDNLEQFFSGLELNVGTEISAVEEADPVAAFTEVTRTQQAFEAAMQVSAAARTPNIFELLF